MKEWLTIELKSDCHYLSYQRIGHKFHDKCTAFYLDSYCVLQKEKLEEVFVIFTHLVEGNLDIHIGIDYPTCHPL